MKLACGRFRVDGRGAERRSKTWARCGGSSRRRVDGVGSGISARKQPKQPGPQRGPGTRSAGSASLSGLAGCQQATV